MTRKFTGWHMTAILVGFFGIVISVNVYMARTAVGTFGGTVVENSYVASQKFNSWLDKAAAQKALGWTVTTRLTADRHVDIAAQVAGAPLQGAEVAAIVRHPLGRTPEQRLAFRQDGGHWLSDAPLPAGRWLVHVQIRRGKDGYQSIENLQ
jgi:nitrogen fixation protein FixH